MLISYQRENDNVKIPLNSSEVNVSTLELHDPYTVNPDLSPGVSHVSLCHVSSINMSLCHPTLRTEDKSYAFISYSPGVHGLFLISHYCWRTRLHHEFNCILALLEKQKGFIYF